MTQDNTLPPSHAVERFIGELIVGEMLQVYGRNVPDCVKGLMLFSSDNRQFAIIYMIVEVRSRHVCIEPGLITRVSMLPVLCIKIQN